MAAQQHYDWDDFEEEYISDEERAEDDDVISYLEELRQLADQPMNINTATVEDLLRLPFLSEAQIEQIHAYIYLHGQMQTLSELRLVPLIDDATRQRLSLFTYAGATPETKTTAKQRLTDMHHDLSTRLDVPLYYRKGQQPGGAYRGDPLYSRIRYKLTGKHLQVGVRTEKDPGERFYDTYGAYAMVEKTGILDKAIVGDYRIGFGEGLVLGGSTWNSKSTPSLKTQGGARPMTGMDEVNYLRGAAVTLRPAASLSVSLFGSYRKRDATLNKDDELQTLQSSGYHRTESEWKSRRNTGSTLAGANLSWQHAGWHAGATGYWQHFDRNLNPGTAYYRAIAPRGKSFGAASLNYGYSRYHLSLAGETAYSTAGNGMATVNRATWTISRRYILSAVQRFYAYQYFSFYSSSMSENTTAQNESGCLVHLSAEPLQGLKVTAYADFFHNPWPRYRMTHSSTGQDFMLQGTYTLNPKHTLLARYQLKRKETADVMEPHHRTKVQWTFEPGKNCRWQTTASMHNVLGSTGWAVQEGFRYVWQKPAIRLAATTGYFNTDDYNSRIYAVLPALFSSISSTSFSGEGIHTAITARWEPGKHWMVEARYSMLRYLDRNEQGSGHQLIMSPRKNDISFQIRLKL